MSVGHAYIGGVMNFFSVWIFCLMQIVPFFFAFFVGASLPRGDEASPPRPWQNILLAALAPLVGYSAVFVSMGMTTTWISKSLFRHLELFNQFGGVVLGLVGSYMAGLLVFREPSVWLDRLKAPFALAFGAALALAYKPCVTPTLTMVINLNTSEETAVTGAIMLAFYTMGTVTSILAVGYAVAFLIHRLPSAAVKKNVRRFCGVVILAAGALVLTGRMTEYKSFLVSRFIADEPGHSGHEAPHLHEGTHEGGPGE